MQPSGSKRYTSSSTNTDEGEYFYSLQNYENWLKESQQVGGEVTHYDVKYYKVCCCCCCSKPNLIFFLFGCYRGLVQVPSGKQESILVQSRSTQQLLFGKMMMMGLQLMLCLLRVIRITMQK
jgi:hypothetical protein